MIRVASALISLFAICTVAFAQGASNALDPLRPLPNFEASGSTEVLRHRSPLGTPCLGVLGNSRPHTTNPNLYDHVVIVTNSCAQRIALRVCYYGTDECVAMEVPGNERREAVLGTLPSVKDFRFEFREKFF
jgi:hypothetical protein